MLSHWPVHVVQHWCVLVFIEDSKDVNTRTATGEVSAYANITKSDHFRQVCTCIGSHRDDSA